MSTTQKWLVALFVLLLLRVGTNYVMANYQYQKELEERAVLMHKESEVIKEQNRLLRTQNQLLRDYYNPTLTPLPEQEDETL